MEPFCFKFCEGSAEVLQDFCFSAYLRGLRGGFYRFFYISGFYNLNQVSVKAVGFGFVGFRGLGLGLGLMEGLFYLQSISDRMPFRSFRGWVSFLGFRV